MAQMYDSDPGASSRPERRHDDVSQRKNYLMSLADQVDRADGGSPFPRILHSPLGAVAVILLLIAVVALIGVPLFVAR